MKKGLFLILIILISVSTNIAKAESDMQATNRMMNDCINNQLCYKASAQSQTVFVYDDAWRMATIDQKQNIGRFFLEYVQLRNNEAKFVDIKSAYSGRNLGKYVEYFGYKE